MNYTFERNGKTIAVYNCGGKMQDKMCENGWRLKLAEFRETPEELYDRLASYGYSKVKVYWTGTAIRGIRDYFAFVK